MIDVAGDVLRVVVSLAAVLLLMWMAARLMRRTTQGRATGSVEVLARAPLSRTASLAVVRVGERALVVGVGDGRVSLLTETDLDQVHAPAPARETRELVVDLAGLGAAPSAAGARAPRGRLTGSALSPATWRTAVEVLRERTARRA